MSARLRRRYVRRIRSRVYPPPYARWHHNDRMYGRQMRKARRRNPPVYVTITADTTQLQDAFSRLAAKGYSLTVPLVEFHKEAIRARVEAAEADFRSSMRSIQDTIAE